MVNISSILQTIGSQSGSHPDSICGAYMFSSEKPWPSCRRILEPRDGRSHPVGLLVAQHEGQRARLSAAWHLTRVLCQGQVPRCYAPTHPSPIGKTQERAEQKAKTSVLCPLQLQVVALLTMVCGRFHKWRYPKMVGL